MQRRTRPPVGWSCCVCCAWRSLSMFLGRRVCSPLLRNCPRPWADPSGAAMELHGGDIAGRRTAAGWRPAGGPVRAPSTVPYRTGAVYRVIAGLRPGRIGDPADRRAGRSGRRGALLIPAALSLLTGTFPEGRERNRAVAAWSAIGGIGATAGLLIGGLITAGAGWQWVFLINVPIGVVLLALGRFLLPEPPRVIESRRVDLPGSITITGGLALFIYGVSQIPSVGWASWRSIGAFLAGVAGLAVLARISVGR